nr:hypothetical protein [Methylobacterium sp. ZNC0032]
MSAMAAHPNGAEERGVQRARRGHAASSILRGVWVSLLIATALMIACLLVAAEATREREAGCHQRSYRDPVTGRQMERSCRVT